MNVKKYIIDYVKFVLQRVPEELRKVDLLAYLNVIVGSIVYIYNNLILFRDQIIYKLTITPQVCFLEKMLNDRYDNVLRSIYIEDGAVHSPLFVFTTAEAQPVFIYLKSEASKPKTFLYSKGEVSTVTFDFIVFVPVEVSFDVDEMSALVNSYKLASKLFSIQTF